MAFSRLVRVLSRALGLLGLVCGIPCVVTCSGRHDTSLGRTHANDGRDTSEEDSTTTPNSSASSPDACPTLSLPFESLPRVGQGALTIQARLDQTPFPVQVEVLQWPDPDTAATWDNFDEQNIPPEDWDRSEVPAGACVIRFLNIAGWCSGSLWPHLETRTARTTNAEQQWITWTGYDEYLREQPEMCAYAPGCQSPMLGSPWQLFYVRERGPDLDFVWCSHACTLPESITVLEFYPVSSAPCSE